ncbi:MAG: hypothetical protein ACREJ3_00920 [Polyangiaceae bacterium]
MRARGFAMGLAAALVVFAFGRGRVLADEGKRAPTIEIGVIYAAHSDGGTFIDPALRDLPQLTRDKPFIRYNVYKVLDKARLPLDVGLPRTVPLVNGRTLQITLVSVETAAGPPPEPRFHVRVAIGRPGKAAFLKLLEVTAGENEPFFVGGQSYRGGTLFLELVMRP